MHRKTIAAAAAFVVLAGLASAPSAFATEEAAAPRAAKAAAQPLVFDSNGDVVAGDAEVSSVTLEDEWKPGEKPEISTFACEETKNKPKRVLTKARHFLIDKKEPFSSWLQPGQSASYTVSKQHDIGVEVTVGVAAEAGAFLAKASSSLDITVSASMSVSKGWSVSDTNSTNRAYRVRMGNQGWKIIETREWWVAPCNLKKEVIYSANAPEPGDITLGRFNS